MRMRIRSTIEYSAGARSCANAHACTIMCAARVFPLIVRGCGGKGSGPGMSAFGFAKWVFSKREAMNNITCIPSVRDHDSACGD